MIWAKDDFALSLFNDRKVPHSLLIVNIVWLVSVSRFLFLIVNILIDFFAAVDKFWDETSFLFNWEISLFWYSDDGTVIVYVNVCKATPLPVSVVKEHLGGSIKNAIRLYVLFINQLLMCILSAIYLWK